MKKRRLLADVTFLYKALHGIIDIDVEPYVDFYKETDHYAFRHNDKLTLEYTFFHRAVGKSNSLPLSIRKATSVNSFKALAKKFLWISIVFEYSTYFFDIQYKLFYKYY